MKRMILAIAVLCLASRCASVAHGRYQQVPVNSSPSGANVSVDCGKGTQAAGQTPVTVNLKRNAEPCTLAVSKDGYEDAKVAFAKSISGWTWGNLVIGGIIGWIIDGADGAIYNRVPDTVQVNLTKK
jgi:hypothetical protein